MLLITTALMLEAQPLKSRFGLAADSGSPFPVYSDAERILVVTGTGSLQAAAATGWALGNFSDIECAVNLGFSAGRHETFRLHQWHLINAVRDELTGRLMVPDLVWDFHMTESGLLTVGKPVDKAISWDGLVDMEGSGFFSAARHFLPPDRIVLLKWVSDNFSARLDSAETSEAYQQSLTEVEPVLQHLQNLDAPEPAVDSTEVKTLLERINLTSTQREYLRKWVRGYLARGGDWQRLLDTLPPRPPRSKLDNKRLFEEMKNVLKG